MRTIFYTIETAAEELGLTVKQILRCCHDKTLKPCYRVAGRLQIPEHAIEKYREKHKGGAYETD